MIRTDIVNLTVFDAVAYRHKLPSGGSGVTILRYDMDQPGIASISKTSGGPVPAANTRLDHFPMAAFREAIRLTTGLPYNKRGSVRLEKKAVKEAAPETVNDQKAAEAEAVVESSEYRALVEHYTDKSGKLSYELLNRELVRFAHSSRVVRAMAEEGRSLKDIRSYVVCSKIRTVSGNKKLTEAQALTLADMLDTVNIKSVFKTLNAEIRKLLAAGKKQ